MYKEIEKLLELSRSGDMEAKERLLLKLKPLLIHSIRRYYNRIEKYDDLIQDGNELILKAIEEYDPDRGVYFLGYVKAMLRYCYLDKHRERQELSLNQPLDRGELMDMLEGDEEDPAQILVRTEEHSLLVEALANLTERQRTIIVAYYIHRMSIGEIAAKLGVSYRTIVNTKTLAIKRLREAMVK